MRPSAALTCKAPGGTATVAATSAVGTGGRVPGMVKSLQSEHLTQPRALHHSHVLVGDDRCLTTGPVVTNRGIRLWCHGPNGDRCCWGGACMRAGAPLSDSTGKDAGSGSTTRRAPVDALTSAHDIVFPIERWHAVVGMDPSSVDVRHSRRVSSEGF